MKNLSLVFISFALALGLNAQNVYEISIASFANSRDLNDVMFALYQNNAIIVEQESNNGVFHFIMKEGDGYFRLKATKKGFIPKVIHFPSDNYPFINEYEIQEIDVEFHKETAPGDESEIGELKWSSLGHEFNVIHVDSTLEYEKQNYVRTEKNMGKIYIKAIESGDELMTLGEGSYAKNHYEIALMAKPNDEYAKSKILEISTMKPKESDVMKGMDKETMDKINKGELKDIPKNLSDDIIYSVQLGAFSQNVSASDFPGVEDFNVINYEDYNRVFSGEFSDLNEAIRRKNELAEKGYKDAWIVQMKGNTRIGF